MGDQETLRQWVREELERQRWSGNELARRAGLSTGAVADFLTGRTVAGFKFCQRVADAFQVPPESLLRLGGLLPPAPPETAQTAELLGLFAQLERWEQDIVLLQVRALVERRAQIQRRASGRILPYGYMVSVSHRWDPEGQTEAQ